MFSVLLPIIYAAFISLGLPDSLLGSAWPTMVGELGVPLSGAGLVSMIISAGTIVSSLFSDRLTRKLGAGPVTAISVLLTACALLGFSLSGSYWMLCLLAVPYGLGAGAVDAALNNYVALHYASRHMNWLHCFWGVGATVGPYIMGWAITHLHNWRLGYGTVSGLQFVLALGLFFSLPLWVKKTDTKPEDDNYEAPIGLGGAVRIPGVKALLMAFCCYCGFELTAMLWGCSYLTEFRQVDPEQAATFGSLFFWGLTLGRFLCGFVSDRIGDKNMIRIGIAVIAVGLLLVLLPVSPLVFPLGGLVILGFGAAPIYPAIIHSTPVHFGKENSHAIVGIQMASAYVGSLLVPPLFGLIAQNISMALFPYYMSVFVIVMFWMTEKVNRICKS